MRNKIFIGVFSGFLLLVMLGAPVKMALTNAGLIESDNVGNIIEVDKFYEGESLYAKIFNGIEEGKRLINDVYTNYIPFYVEITSAASTFRTNVNQPITTYLMNKGNEILLKQREDAAKNPVEIDPPVTDAPSTETDASGETVATTESVVTAPPFDPIYNATYLKGDSRHRYYEIKAQESADEPMADFFVRIPALTNEQLRPNMESQIKKINDFQNRRPDVNWYVFPVTCFEDTELCDMLLPSESKRELFLEFFTKLDERVQYDYIDINTFAEKDRMYFKTDHHWNVYGYTEGYRLMAELFKENYSDIEVMTPDIYTYDNKITIQGSNARATANYSITNDYFHVADFHLPTHNLTIENGVSYGGREDPETRYKRYADGKYNTERTYDHYIEFFRIAEKIVYPENNTGRNLLIICDSYSPPLQEALASHFDTTIVRYVDSNPSLEVVKYEDLIDDNNITDVLLFEMSDRVIYDYYNGSLLNIN